MQEKEPYLGNDDQPTPSWMRRKPKRLTFWTIAWAVCVGILLANTIEALIAALTFYINIHLYFDPAVKRLMQ